MNVVLNEYDLLENLIIESYLINHKDKNFFKNKKRFNILYENVLHYIKLKLLRLKDIHNNIEKYVNFDSFSVLTESLNQKEIELLKENLLDTIKSGVGSAVQAVKGAFSSVVDYARKNPADFWQLIGDLVSIIDPTGLVDLINGSIYFARKEWVSALFSFIGAAFALPGFLESLTVVGAVAGVPMIVAGKTIKNLLKFGGKIVMPILRASAVVLKEGGAIMKVLEVGAKIPGLKTFMNWIKSIIPKFVTAVKTAGESGTVSGILSQAIGGKVGDVIVKTANAGEKLVAKGTSLATAGAKSTKSFKAAEAGLKAGEEAKALEKVQGVTSNVYQTAAGAQKAGAAVGDLTKSGQKALTTAQKAIPGAVEAGSNKMAADIVSKYTTAVKPSKLQMGLGAASVAGTIAGARAADNAINQQNPQQQNPQQQPNYEEDYEQDEQYYPQQQAYGT